MFEILHNTKVGVFFLNSTFDGQIKSKTSMQNSDFHLGNARALVVRKLQSTFWGALQAGK